MRKGGKADALGSLQLRTTDVLALSHWAATQIQLVMVSPSRVIHDLYEAFLPENLNPGDVLMHDEAPVHRARIVRELLDELGITVMEWSPYSPDLSPIENLWGLLKAAIYERYPDLERAPNNRRDPSPIDRGG